MEAHATKPANAVVVAAAIALIVFCAAGVAAVMGWIPNTLGDGVGDGAAPLQIPAPGAVAVAPTAYATKPRPAEARPAAPVTVARAGCGDCGVVESVREVEQAGQGTGLGAVGGAVAGAVLGQQIGGRGGRDLMTVVGAVAGGVAGNQIEKKVRSTKSYEITVRMEDGSTRVSSESAAPSWRPGDRVRLIDGRIHPGNA